MHRPVLAFTMCLYTFGSTHAFAHVMKYPQINDEFQLFLSNDRKFARKRGDQSIRLSNAVKLQDAGLTSGTEGKLGSTKFKISIDKKINDIIRAVDYGVVCDGTTNDSAASARAIAAATGRTLVFPRGTCLVDTLYYAPSPQKPITIKGEGRGATIIRKFSASAASIIQLGKNPSTGPYYDIRLEGLTFDGLDKSVTSTAVLGYDLWRITFRDVEVRNAKVGIECNGCIYVYLDNILATLNETGLRFRQLVSSGHGNTPPNLIQVQASQLVRNSLLGIDFDDGALLSVRGSSVEYNGTIPGIVDSGGILAGQNLGRHNIGTHVPGLLVSESWFEGNLGEANIIQKSGRGAYRDNLFWSSPAETTYDFKITGGVYEISNNSMAAPSKQNVLNAAGVSAGNIIIGTSLSTLTVDREKTTIVRSQGQGARYRLDAQIIPNNHTALASWTTATFDPQALRSNANNLCVPSGFDRARVTAGLGWNYNGTGIRQISILKNGVEVSVTSMPGLGFNFQNVDSGLINVAGGDCFSVGLYQNSGKPLSVVTNQGDFFSLELLR
ncbi:MULTISPECIES: glycosyl hydrolase family 28-related protein [Methylobacterium]|uniref:glycosyl hydrolase family 28-related protein n=1 Tax=Methylobacterium TaxID=407 RepID=UPI0009E82B22|nr:MULTISPECIES: glycosyl hydrolase family 28-related protein [Methylobacterium]MCI9882920.1 hypothetical protein [Methylobacterium goesingense]